MRIERRPLIALAIVGVLLVACRKPQQAARPDAATPDAAEEKWDAVVMYANPMTFTPPPSSPAARVSAILRAHGIPYSSAGSRGITGHVPHSRAPEARRLLDDAVRNEGIEIEVIPMSP